MKETHTVLKDCHDCAAKPGELHHLGCDVERCHRCGYQLISCDCWDEDTPPPDAERVKWTGIWPGEVECIRWGWFCKWTGGGWQRCDGADPEAGPDLNRLHSGEAHWDPLKKEWVLNT